MKILVTGGAGFIGSAVVRQAVRDGHEVVNLDKLTYAANLANVAPVENAPGYTFEQADICDRAALDRIFERHRPDIVMHLAAESHVDRSIDGPAAFVETNITGTYSLLEDHTLRPTQPLFSLESCVRSSCAGMARNLWPASGPVELLE